MSIATQQAQSPQDMDSLVAANSCFADMNALVNAEGGYRPSLDVSDADRLCIADAYDDIQAARGDERRAYRYGSPEIKTKRLKAKSPKAGE